MSQSQIAARIDAFTTELNALVRRAALEAVSAALGGSAATGAPAGQPVAAPRRRGRPPKSSRPAVPATSAAASATKLPTKPRKGGKRSPEQLAKIDAAVQAFVKANPGKGVEHMAKSLGVPSGDIKSRVALLIEAKKLKKTGVKRASKYFVS
jgi:hypothetical protein